MSDPLDLPFSRRRFLQTGAAAAAAVALPRVRAAAVSPAPRAMAPKVPVDQRLLVVLEMAGGNDGLSMVVPYDDPHYARLRTNTGVAADSTLPLGDHVGLHPQLARLHADGVAVVAGVGVAAPDLSHFEMLRRWWTADPDGTRGPDTGFLGRVCDVIGDPSAPAVGVSLGYGPTMALASDRVVTLALDPYGDGAFPTRGDDPADEAWLTGVRTMATSVSTDPLLGLAQRGRAVALNFADVAMHLPKPAHGYPTSELGAQLRLAARLLAADTGIRVVHVPFEDDFDTHDDHAERYGVLMRKLDRALHAFRSDLEQRGLADRVLIATVSEFGRRVPDNGSSGLDHGAASCAFLAGPVNHGIHGEMPRLDRLDHDDNLVATVSMNDYYATIAESWLGVPATEVLVGPATPLPGVVA